MKNQRPQSAFSKQLGYGLTVSFIALYFFSSAPFVHAATANLSMRLAPTSGIDATTSTAKKMAPGNLIALSESEPRTPAYALFSWPNTLTAYNENKYIEL